MELDQLLHDRQTKPQTSVSPGDGAVGLTKPFKDHGQQLRSNPDSGVGHRHDNVILSALQYQVYASLAARELDGVGHEVPGNLLEPLRIAADCTGIRIKARADLHRLGVRLASDRGLVSPFAERLGSS